MQPVYRNSVPRMTRRVFVGSIFAATLGGCTTTGVAYSNGMVADKDRFTQMYGPIAAEKFPVPAVNLSQVQSKYYRREVKYETREAPGTLIVDPHAKFLYLIQENSTAMRYGIGVGRQGFSWSGRATIGWKRKWPKWTPPAEMIEREPELVKYANGMEPGLSNPLGARALYLFQGGKDTLYRIHGTLEAYSIGKAVSSGCIRLLNQDVIDLYNRVKSGATVIVLGSAARFVKSSVGADYG